MKILFAASEAAPYIKSGGLGDVIGSLPVALAEQGCEVSCIIPLYDAIGPELRARLTFVTSMYVPLSWRNQYCGVFKLEERGVTWYFIDNEYYFKRGSLYGSYDDCERFSFFSQAVLATVGVLGLAPDIIHCHDWQTACIPVYLRTLHGDDPACQAIKTVFTIHNIEYQGIFGREVMENVLGLPYALFDEGTMRHNDAVNLMKSAILFADRVTTVSPTYAQEILTPEYGHGLDSVLRMEQGKLCGILNGIDVSVSPENDPRIVKNYSVKTLRDKKANTDAARELMNLPLRDDVPLIVMITRLVQHKGLDLVCEVLDQLLEQEVQMIVLGSGEWQYEQFLRDKAWQYPTKLAVYIGFHAELAQKLYAAADLFLMPSKSEPCGLAQMIAMHYGAVPVVRETGGLRDTVSPYNQYTGEGLGFTFRNYHAPDMLHVLGEACALWHDRGIWEPMMKRDMQADFSWKHSAGEYRALYQSLL